MKYAFLIVMLTCASLCSMAASSTRRSNSASPLHLMLTSFDPFGGSSANNSQPIVAELKAQAASLGENVVVDTCNLPVIYDQASIVAMQCVSQYKPDVVISFGEADCDIRIETAATNLDNTPDLGDNAGQIRTGNPIVSGGPARSGFNFPVQSMFCALNSKPSQPMMPVEVSIDPGAFVCNNTAYHMSRNLEATKTPFTFIHVPNSECSDAQKDPVANAKTIAQMLNAAIANLRAPLLSVDSLFPHPGNATLMPTVQTEAQALEKALGMQNTSKCEAAFAQQLVSLYN